jgi:hypothetical protein
VNLETSLDLWLKYRNAAEQRTYWFLLAQATVFGLVVSNLDKLFVEKVPAVLVVSSLSAVGFASAIVTVSSIIAYRWDWERLAAVQRLVEEPQRTPFTADWGKGAALSPFGFSFFHFAVGAGVAISRESRDSMIIVVTAAVATACVALFLTKEARASQALNGASRASLNANSPLQPIGSAAGGADQTLGEQQLCGGVKLMAASDSDEYREVAANLRQGVVLLWEAFKTYFTISTLLLTAFAFLQSDSSPWFSQIVRQALLCGIGLIGIALSIFGMFTIQRFADYQKAFLDRGKALEAKPGLMHESSKVWDASSVSAPAMTFGVLVAFAILWILAMIGVAWGAPNSSLLPAGG